MLQGYSSWKALDKASLVCLPERACQGRWIAPEIPPHLSLHGGSISRIHSYIPGQKSTGHLCNLPSVSAARPCRGSNIFFKNFMPFNCLCVDFLPATPSLAHPIPPTSDPRFPARIMFLPGSCSASLNHRRGCN